MIFRFYLRLLRLLANLSAGGVSVVLGSYSQIFRGNAFSIHSYSNVEPTRTRSIGSIMLPMSIGSISLPFRQYYPSTDCERVLGTLALRDSFSSISPRTVLSPEIALLGKVQRGIYPRFVTKLYIVLNFTRISSLPQAG